MIEKITLKSGFLIALAAPYAIFSMCNESEIEKKQKRIEVLKDHFFVKEKTEDNLFQIEKFNSRQEMTIQESMFQAIKDEDFWSLKWFVEKGADINVKNNDGRTPLHIATGGSSLKIVQYLVEKGANINDWHQNSYERPLHIAANDNNLTIVRYLVEKGADINAIDGRNRVPLHCAARKGNFEIVKYLIERGAKINVKSCDDKTPLAEAIIKGNLVIVKYLVEQGADINDKYNGTTMLHFAAGGSCNFETVKYLIEKGVGLNIQNSWGSTPLHMAVGHSNLKTVKYLVKKGADINVRDSNKQTPLHRAVKGGHLEIVKYLVEKGSSVNAQDDSGKTPFYIAFENNQTEIAKYFLENGCDIPGIKKFWKNNLLDGYLFSPKRTGDYIIERQRYIKLIKPPIKSSYRELSTNSFEINSKNILQYFNHELELELNNRLSVNSIIKKEKAIVKKGNYSIAHGRSTKFDRFVNDQVFLYLMDIFNIFFGNDREIDKTCHYTQHYAFPGEKWEEAFMSKGKTCDFRGLTINLPSKEVANLLNTGITSSKELSYKRSTLQFGANPLGTKPGSSPLGYVFKNGNVDEKRGSVTLETLFKHLSKMLGKDLSKYYQKYKTAFELICKAGEKFEHGTLLLYEFTPKTLQEYVKVTHSSGGHIDNKDSGILIKGKRTTDPKKVLDTLINNPEDFDEPTHDYEYFWPLTDEVTANMHSNEVKTYAFHIGKHDEMLAKNIKHWIAKVFEYIRCDMAQDGIIKYDAMNKSKL